MDDAALTRFLDAAFAFACTRRVAEFVDVDRLIASADVAGEPSRVARMVRRFVAPGRARVLDRLRASSLPLGVWLPDGRSVLTHRVAPGRLAFSIYRVSVDGSSVVELTKGQPGSNEYPAP